jgi:hypothetical protein
MSWSTDAQALLDRMAARMPLPRVRSLHLPPPPAPDGERGEFCALELDDGSLGLAYVLLGDTLAGLMAGSADLIGADALDVAGWWVQREGAARAVGFAAVNALTRHLFDRAGFAPPTAADSIGGLNPQAGEHIGMVGLFPPLVKAVTASGARLTVLELRPELAGAREGFRVTLDPRELASCGKVLSTSTVLLNGTLGNVLAHCAAARSFALIGPGAACLPDPLFRRGITLVGGAWIEDAAAFKAALTTGQAWGSCARKFALTQADYPGLAALLARTGRSG